ncbi:psychosine receptor [Varanus komodoensis]|uniref:G protein-coupled receptor 65 n=1 Tax=Varanus komodoensis TaxID=61221 RepID=A0A8D2Q7D1_VARKO|nr:psychosine receptor [Varanus komodoensis]
MNCVNLTCGISHELDKYLFPVLYSILIIISIPVNCISLYISCGQVKKKNELGIYLLSLTLADLLYTLTLPLWIYYAQNGDDWKLSENFCMIAAFLKHLNYYTSAGFLTCISLDRYIAVVYPLRFHYLRTRRFALLISALVWGFEIMSNYQILKHKETTTKINRTLCYDTYPLENWQAWFNFYRICVGYAIPLVIMVFCYQRIYQAVKHNQATQESDKKKISYLLLSIIITFILCFTPYHVVLLMRSISEPCNCDFAKIMFAPYRITTALTSFNCIADPILYCFVSENGRTDMWSLFKSGCSESQTDEHRSQMVPLSTSHRCLEKQEICLSLNAAHCPSKTG